MQAIGYKRALPIANPNSLLDFEPPIPMALEQDLLVEATAVSVNPVDAKIRASTQPAEGAYRVLGFDATGVVKAIGARVTLFRPGGLLRTTFGTEMGPINANNPKRPTVDRKRASARKDRAGGF